MRRKAFKDNLKCFYSSEKEHMKHKGKQEKASHYLIPKNEHNAERLASTPWQPTCTLPEHSTKLLELIQVKTLFFKG